MATPENAARRGRVSQKASRFTESVIREMTREALKHGAVNLSQGAHGRQTGRAGGGPRFRSRAARLTIRGGQEL